MQTAIAPGEPEGRPVPERGPVLGLGPSPEPGPRTVAQLAAALGAVLALPPALDANGNPVTAAEAAQAHALLRNQLLQRVASARDADSEAVIFAENAAALSEATQSQAGVLLLPQALAETVSLPRGSTMALLLADRPRFAFARAHRLLQKPDPPLGVHPTASVAATAQIGRQVTIGAFAVVEGGAVVGAGTAIGAGAVVGAGAVLGVGCRLYPRVVLYPGVRLGDRVVVHAGAVLGADGFGYVRDYATGAYLQFPQQGVLVVEDDVEIGANTTVDRGALEETRIGRGTKIDNLVHVGHNVQIGEDVVIAAQTGISGSSTVGEGAVIAGQVGIADHVSIGPGVVLGAQAGVPSRKRLLGPGAMFWGTPARPIAGYLRELATLARLVRKRRADEPLAAGESGTPDPSRPAGKPLAGPEPGKPQASGD